MGLHASRRPHTGHIGAGHDQGHQRDVPYQLLIKMFLAERVAEERRRAP